MGQREIIIKESVADSIAEIAWYIESKGLVATAEKFLQVISSWASLYHAHLQFYHKSEEVILHVVLLKKLNTQALALKDPYRVL